MKLKLLQLSNLTVSPSECPADKEKIEKPHFNTKNICFAFVKRCISFDHLHNITQRNISKCLDVFGGLFRRLSAPHISTYASFRVRNPRQNCVIELIKCFDLVLEDGSHITKATN